jgi:hypothetical protein
METECCRCELRTEDLYLHNLGCLTIDLDGLTTLFDRCVSQPAVQFPAKASGCHGGDYRAEPLLCALLFFQSDGNAQTI